MTVNRQISGIRAKIWILFNVIVKREHFNLNFMFENLQNEFEQPDIFRGILFFRDYMSRRTAVFFVFTLLP